ncbi:MAG: AAA family ATPase [Candidatus Brocadiae bacterium]|nr:AAA family ATPase [Candidatus Brocadiia bacterium]
MINFEAKEQKNLEKNIIPFEWHSIAFKMLKLNRLSLFVGEPGSGKTTWAMMAALKFTGQEGEILQGTPDTEISHIWGFFALANGETKFCDGPLPRALKKGRFLIVEELNLIPIEARSSFLTLRGHRNITNPFTGEELPIPDSFRLIATSNPENLKCRNQPQIAQMLLDDFVIMEVPRMTAKEVELLLSFHYPDTSTELLGKVSTLWQKYENVNKMYLSYRAAKHLMSLLLSGIEENEAIRIALINKYITDSDVFTTAQLKFSISDEDMLI